MGAGAGPARSLAAARAALARLGASWRGRPVRLEAVGSVRRGVAVAGDIDVLAVSRAPRLDAMSWTLGGRPVAAAALVWGGGRRARLEAGGAAFDLFLAAPAERPTALFHLTGPRSFNVRTRAAAKRKGWRLNQYGLWDARTGARVAAFATERAVFAALGVTYRRPADRR